MSKRFTLAEAQRLIPRVEPLLRDAIAFKAEYEEGDKAFDGIIQRVMMAGGMVVDSRPAEAAKKKRESAAEKLRAAIEEVQEIGCVIKDLDIGLIDFPTQFRGAEVYLCWKLGEPRIEFWHGVDEGFRGRKRIDQEFRDHHRGDRA